MRMHISHPNKIINMRGKARGIRAERDDGSEKSCSSTSREVIEKGSGIFHEGLEVEEVAIVNRRCNFIRRRSLTNTPKKNAGNQQKTNQSRQLQKHAPNIASGISQQNSNPQVLLILRNALKSKILSGIDLSIISQSKNQSKLDTPQCKVPVRNEKQSHSNGTTTFNKWSQSRKPPTKKQPSFSRVFEFSDHSIRDLTINPCLNSFHQDRTLNDSAVVQKMGFKEFLSKSCKLLPTIIPAQRVAPLDRDFSREKKNSAVKKIINMEKLFAEKGIPLASSNIDTPSLANKKDVLAQLFEKQKSMIRFETSLESVVHFEPSIEQED